MSFNARNRYDPSRRRRRRNIHNHSSSSHSHITRLATTAALAYGAYRLGSWAWDSYFGKDNYDNDEENYVFGEGSGYDSESESESDDYDDACAQSSRPNGNDDDEPSRKDLRSRRSRGDWSKYNHRHRSHPHSPHHHHHHDNATTNKNGSKSSNNNSVGSSVGEKIMTSTTAAIGAAVSAGISAGINAYNNNNNNVASAQFIRSSRMERCRLETSRAMMDFLPTLKKAIVKETDITSEMEELKSIRSQKKRDLQSKNGDDAHTHQPTNGDNDVRERERELWNNIKNKSITRLVTTIYAHTIVFLVLTVQVNLLGGRLLREEQEKNHQQQQEEDDKDESLDEQSSDDESDRYRSSHKTVLAKTYHHVFAKGIPSLAAAVAKAVDDALQNWDVLGGDDASLDDVSSWLETVRDVIEKRQEKGGNNSSSSTTGALVQFVIPDEMGQSNDEPMVDDLARYILDETYDLLESPTYAHAERLCLDITFTNLREEGYANLFPSPTRRNNNHVDEGGDGAVERKPLAKVITHLSKPTVATFYETPSHKAEMEDWEGVFRMMEEPLPSSPNVYIPNLSHAVTELSDICFN
ncbi:hypothetical protein ACHAWC_006437 [Mediolabrus comicus]